ncbi:Uncharacterized protein HZ326_13486 [Fusarium oxysporum f. sp. albedinis]|nr:Uncharacterized protein HZ326_13486 [Fusarium oxysporum f. sp. albedinis]
MGSTWPISSASPDLGKINSPSYVRLSSRMLVSTECKMRNATKRIVRRESMQGLLNELSHGDNAKKKEAVQRFRPNLVVLEMGAELSNHMDTSPSLSLVSKPMMQGPERATQS